MLLSVLFNKFFQQKKIIRNETTLRHVKWSQINFLSFFILTFSLRTLYWFIRFRRFVHFSKFFFFLFWHTYWTKLGICQLHKATSRWQYLPQGWGSLVVWPPTLFSHNFKVKLLLFYKKKNSPIQKCCHPSFINNLGALSLSLKTVISNNNPLPIQRWLHSHLIYFYVTKHFGRDEVKQ